MERRRRIKRRSKLPWEKRWPRYIISRARQVWRWCPARKEALKNAKIKGVERFNCINCKKQFPKEGVAVDHINPAISPIKGWEGWDTFLNKLLRVSSASLQVLCKGCHRVKTKEENKIRRQCVKDQIRSM